MSREHRCQEIVQVAPMFSLSTTTPILVIYTTHNSGIYDDNRRRLTNPDQTGERSWRRHTGLREASNNSGVSQLVSGHLLPVTVTHGWCLVPDAPSPTPWRGVSARGLGARLVCVTNMARTRAALRGPWQSLPASDSDLSDSLTRQREAARWCRQVRI